MPEAAQPAVPLPKLVCRIPLRIGQFGDELLEVQPVALDEEADEVLAGRRRDRAKSADKKVAISTRPGSGAALRCASIAAPKAAQGAVDRAGSTGPASYAGNLMIA